MFILAAPSGIGQFQSKSGISYTVSSTGTITVPLVDLADALACGFTETNGPLGGASTVVAAQNVLGIGGPVTLQLLGDSISALNDFNANFASNVPAWKQGTTYIVNNSVTSNGNLYVCSAAGVAGATAPSGGGGSDGGATWAFTEILNNRRSDGYQNWIEKFLSSSVTFDPNTGYGGYGVQNIKVVQGGNNYK